MITEKHLLFPREVLAVLRANGLATLRDHRVSPVPAVKIINPYGQSVWLLSESDPADPDHLYGLFDLGRRQRPLLTHVSRDVLEHAYVEHGYFRHPLERDPHFSPTHSLAVYARAARTVGRITEHPDALAHAAAALATTHP